MCNTILFLRSRVLSYSSEEVFFKQMIKQFGKAGFQTKVCFLGAIETEEERLRGLIGKKYRAIVDINSTLPVVTVDGKYLLDLIDAPFYQVILDHPMHLDERLRALLGNYHVVCVDAGHAAYVKSHYPHIKSVQTMHYPGIKARNEIPFEQRTYKLLFAATYAPLDFFEEKIKGISEKIWVLSGEILEQMKAGAGFETAVEKVCKDRLLTPYKNLAPLSYVDRYIRAWEREHLVDAFLEYEIPLTVCGINWDLYPKASHKLLHWSGSCSYEKIIEMEANAKAILNLQPLFTEGLHDRGANAFANGCALITDGCSFLTEKMDDGYALFDVWKKEGYDRIRGLMTREEELKVLAQNGQEEWKKQNLKWMFSL
ncbi:hypothetical protein [Eubacterium oxidoreducens]|uniref:Glycosyl transferases group 1 n=1 Tax=Eubacterium oxidoreducens TaxID=1732 RepID=A0A1G6CGL4_EUBOX|nr:hypothetical protein [Eubacterium oxidoreducens]SDB32064.1 hypothetical protein SAMN02910417_02389 [Eubacterium oxidoreducens]